MEKINLKVGDIFNFTKVSYLYYRILELDKASNYAKIELICPYDVDNWDENWTISSIEEGFEEKKYAELAYHIYNSVYGTGAPLSDIIKYTFRLLNINSEWTK